MPLWLFLWRTHSKAKCWTAAFFQNTIRSRDAAGSGSGLCTFDLGAWRGRRGTQQIHQREERERERESPLAMASTLVAASNLIERERDNSYGISMTKLRRTFQSFCRQVSSLLGGYPEPKPLSMSKLPNLWRKLNGKAKKATKNSKSP